MFKPAIWLAVSILILMILVFVFVFLLRFQVGVQPPPLTAVQIVTDYLNSVSPWSQFSFTNICNVYQGTHLNTTEEPGANLGNGFVCTPSNMVAGIKGTRQCLKTGCVDLNGIPRDIGYTETAYVDCSFPYTCELSQANCFEPIVNCDYYGDALVSLQYNNICTAYDTTNQSVTSGRCDRQPNQQWLLLPAGDGLYNILQPSGKCLVVDSITKNLTVSSCGTGKWYLAKQAPITVVIKVSPSEELKFTEIMPQQLIWSPDGVKIAIPTTWSPDETFDLLTLQGGKVGAYIPACSNNGDLSLPTCPTFLITSTVLSQ